MLWNFLHNLTVLIDTLLIRDCREVSPPLYYTARDTESKVPSSMSEISAADIIHKIYRELLPSDFDIQNITYNFQKETWFLILTFLLRAVV